MAYQYIITWDNPTTNTDGSPYNAEQDNAGYELAFDNSPAAVALPFAFGTEFDLKTLEAFQSLTPGTHSVRLRVVNKGGIASDWTGGAPFQIYGTPLAPTNLAVA